jgi:hypothetical protein
VRRLLNAGFTGRNREVVMKHVEELKAHGVAAPDRIPAFYPVPRHLVTTEEEIEVLAEQTSGEVEPVFLFKEGSVYLAVGSDHTDREIEKISIANSKIACPKVVSKEIWDYGEVKDGWERLILRSWIGEGGVRKLYQEGSLSAFLPPQELIRQTQEHIKDRNLDGMVLFLGTLPLLGKEFAFSPSFEGELWDESMKRRLTLRYRINPINWLQ